MPHEPWKLLRAWPAQLALLALAVAIAYARTLDVPFYLDDYPRIRENAVIQGWHGFDALRRYEPMRVLGYASLALNYGLGHFDPRGYHLVNVLIHFLAACAAYAFTRTLLATPRVADRASARVRTWLPLLAAALFALHPLQTQAVTYVVQRLASMAALFYVAALAAYLRARRAASAARALAWAAGALLLAGLALFTKENAATLPLAVLLLEAVCFRHGARRLLAIAGAALGGLVLVWVAAAVAFGSNPFALESMRRVTAESASISRGAYLATQMPVLWMYLRLFVWPVGLHLDYSSAPLRGFADAKVLLALAGHLGAVALAAWAWRSRPLVTFAVAFYYLAHAVESGVVPIRDLVFEHRTYLPNLGACILAGWLLLAARPWWAGGSRAVPAIAVAVPLVLGGLTWRRNETWRDPIAFWRDDVRRAPASARAWGNLGKSLAEANRPEEAERALRESLRLPEDGTGSVHALSLVNLVMALQMMKRDDEALALIERNIDLPLEPYARALLELNRGNIQFSRRRFPEAEASFRSVLSAQPRSLPALANLASTLAQTGRLAGAETLYREALDIDPDDAATRANLAKLKELMRRGKAP